MKWLKIIELRSVGCDWELLKSQLQKLVKEVEKEAKKQSINV